MITKKSPFRSFVIMLIGSILVSFPVEADPSNSPKETAALLQARYEKTDVIQARFSQETIPAGATEGISASGRVFFARPDRMRWEYETPDPQLIVTSGQDVFVYEKEANQVLVIPRDQFLNSEVSRAFFLGKGDLERSFRIEAPEGDQSKKWTIKLVPRQDNPQVKTIFITIDPENHLVREMSLEDHMGGKTLLRFTDIALNGKVEGSLFSFTPPQGVEIFYSR